MTTLFSFGFNALFLAFIVAAVLGHVLLIGALLRPFWAKVAPHTRAPATSSLSAQGAH